MPWSASLRDFSVWSLQGDGPHVRLPVLQPVTTTATISIITKQTKSSTAKDGGATKTVSGGAENSRQRRTGAAAVAPTAGETSALATGEAEADKQQTSVSNNIVVHADMSPVRVCGCKRQVQAHVILVESLMHTTAHLINNYTTLMVSEQHIELDMLKEH